MWDCGPRCPVAPQYDLGAVSSHFESRWPRVPEDCLHERLGHPERLDSVLLTEPLRRRSTARATASGLRFLPTCPAAVLRASTARARSGRKPTIVFNRAGRGPLPPERQRRHNRKLVQTLRPLRSAVVEIAGHQLTAQPELTLTAREILDQLRGE